MCEHGHAIADAGKVGKWLVFVRVAEVDALWTRIKEATESGLLGPAAKVSTALANPNATNDAA